MEGGAQRISGRPIDRHLDSFPLFACRLFLVVPTAGDELCEGEIWTHFNAGIVNGPGTTGACAPRIGTATTRKEQFVDSYRQDRNTRATAKE